MSADDVINQAEQAFVLGQLDDAIQILRRQWADAGSAPPRALHLFGAIRFRQGQFEDAEAHFRAALSAEPQNAFRHAALGDLLSYAGKFAAAADSLAQAARIDPKLDGVRRAHARAAFAAGRFAEAEQAARAAIAGGANADLWDTLSCALREQGKAVEAIAAADEALKLEPSNQAAQHSRGAALLRAGRDAEALAVFDTLTAQGVSAPALWLNRGTALARLGRKQEALSALSEGLRRWPQSVQLQQAHAALKQR